MKGMLKIGPLASPIAGVRRPGRETDPPVADHPGGTRGSAPSDEIDQDTAPPHDPAPVAKSNRSSKPPFRRPAGDSGSSRPREDPSVVTPDILRSRRSANRFLDRARPRRF